MRTTITIPTSAFAGYFTVLHDDCISSCNHCPFTLLAFSYTRAKALCSKPDALPSPFPSPFPFLPNAFPYSHLAHQETCFLMPLIPLREVSSRLFHLKACLNPLLFAQFIAPHSISCQAVIVRVSLMCFLLPAPFRCPSSPFDFSCSPFDTKMSDVQSLAHRLITAFHAEHRSMRTPCRNPISFPCGVASLFPIAHGFLVSSLHCKH